ncbi:uncharacterized protein DEA37_0004568, partial [Paragonimus westermani]
FRSHLCVKFFCVVLTGSVSFAAEFRFISSLAMVKLFVGNLNPQSKASDLRKKFEEFGKVTECDVVNNYGFVHMETEADAEAALAGLQNAVLDGVKINVERSHGKRGGGPGPMRRRFRDNPPDRFRGPPPRFMGGGPPPRMGRYGPGWDDGYGAPYGPPPRGDPRGGPPYDYPANGNPGRYPPPERAEPVRPPPRGPGREPLPPPPAAGAGYRGTTGMTITETMIATASPLRNQPRGRTIITIIMATTAVVGRMRKARGLPLPHMIRDMTMDTTITAQAIGLLLLQGDHCSFVFNLTVAGTIMVGRNSQTMQRWRPPDCDIASVSHLNPVNIERIA